MFQASYAHIQLAETKIGDCRSTVSGTEERADAVLTVGPSLDESTADGEAWDNIVVVEVLVARVNLSLISRRSDLLLRTFLLLIPPLLEIAPNDLAL